MSNPSWYAASGPDPYYDGGASQERADAAEWLATFRTYSAGDAEPPGGGPKSWGDPPALGAWDAVVMAWWDFLDICEELFPDEPTAE
jgi:hypothetical protein